MLLSPQTMAVPTSVTAGAAVDVSHVDRKCVTLESVGTATYQLQISLDPSASPAAASWTNEGTALTAAGVIEVTKPCMWMRWNCTAYTSGTPVGRMVGVGRFDA